MRRSHGAHRGTGKPGPSAQGAKGHIFAKALPLRIAEGNRRPCPPAISDQAPLAEPARRLLDLSGKGASCEHLRNVTRGGSGVREIRKRAAFREGRRSLARLTARPSLKASAR